MVYEDFIKEITATLQRRLGRGYQVETRTVRKNNNNVRVGLTVRQEESNVSPCIYLEDYYYRYQTEGVPLDAVIGEIEDMYRNYAVSDMNLLFLEDYENLRKQIRGKLVNTRMNRAFLKTVPHREFLDLSLIYFVAIEGEQIDGFASIQITNAHMKMWGITEQELYIAAKANLEAANDAVFMPTGNMLYELTDDVTFKPEESDKLEPLYVLTTKDHMNGAIQMLNEKFLRTAANTFRCSFMILPSSIHELLLVPDSVNEYSPERLARMVYQVNAECVSSEEVLSYHVYHYSRTSGTIDIAA